MAAAPEQSAAIYDSNTTNESSELRNTDEWIAVKPLNSSDIQNTNHIINIVAISVEKEKVCDV